MLLPICLSWLLLVLPAVASSPTVRRELPTPTVHSSSSDVTQAAAGLTFDELFDFENNADDDLPPPRLGEDGTLDAPALGASAAEFGSAELGGAVDSELISPVTGLGALKKAIRNGIPICCATCHRRDIQCLSICREVCYTANECDSIGRDAYAWYCREVCGYNSMTGENAAKTSYIPPSACRGECAAQVEISCSRYACRDFGCYAPACNRQATKLCNVIS